jgi:hypothetical protein
MTKARFAESLGLTTGLRQRLVNGLDQGDGILTIEIA